MIFISTSGALGRYVDLPVPVTIGARAFIAFLILFLYCKWKGISLNVARNDAPMVILSGFLMGLHWVTYFYALKWSNVAIGMLSLFTYPVLTAFLEPLLLKTKLQKIHLLLGGLVLAGIYLLSPELDFSNSYTLAIAIGIFSALCYALRNLILKVRAVYYHGSMLMVYQTGIITLILLPSFFTIEIDLVLHQWKGILALAILTTAIGHTLFLMTFKHFSITTVSILSSVQPVYGIVIGALFLSEIPELTTILGGTLILASVVIESIRSKKKSGKA
ncbi:DMT family transporter [Maribacter sp. 2210JD10-5]|uniref:DMT family transporter n=1 Tax=Maribacter sp. 2210JD10-5 TaxID=3386272 RepID=UPI0039BD0835